MSNQPTQPDQFDYLEQDTAGDQEGATYVAPDQPMGAQNFGTTASEERAGETFQYRDKHTNPEVWEDAPTESGEAVGRLVQPGDEDVDLVDDETAAVASDSGDMGLAEGDMSAEEAAMHTTDL